MLIAGYLPARADQKKMNGYTLAQFSDFERNWHLVTVRFRKDTNELRFTYANDLAWETLIKGSVTYPDGAIFGKIGVQTKPDPSFPSSATPMGVRRYQLMVMDRTKNANTDGWGYALFDANGNTFPGDEKAATMACAACHRIVPERGEVFSQLMPGTLKKFSVISSADAWEAKLSFTDVAHESLPLNIRKYLPKAFKKVRLLEGDLVHHVFFGTLDEIQPLLAHEVLVSKRPALLLTDDKTQFSLVYPIETDAGCDKRKRQVGLRSVHSLVKKRDSADEVFETFSCQAPES